MPLINILPKLFGHRKPLLNNDNIDYVVQVLAWHHPIYVPAQHVALRIIQDNKEVNYLSYYPKTLEDFSKQSLSKLRTGTSQVFFMHYQDDLLVHGFKKAWPKIKSQLSAEQLALIPNATLIRLSDATVLEVAKKFDEAKRAKLRSIGRPSELIELRSLDMAAMDDKITAYKNEVHSAWAPWAGSFFRKKNTHNCATIILDVLYVGGLGNLLTSEQDVLGILGGLVGVGVFALTGNQSWQEAILDIVLGFVAGRGLGGAYEGYHRIQSFLNSIASQSQDNIATVLGLRVASSVLFTFIGIIKPGPLVPAFLTFPREVLNLVYQARDEEEAVFSPRVNKTRSVHY